MNRRLVDSIAQIILSMTDEERKALAQTVDMNSSSLSPTELSEANKSFRVAEIAQQIATYERNHQAQQPTASAMLTEGSASVSSGLSANQEALSSFFELASSLNTDGPADFLSRLDDYLNEDASSTHE